MFLNEIRADRALQYAGAALALVEAVTCLYWLTQGRIDLLINSTTDPICWPFWPSCGAWRPSTPVLLITEVALMTLALASATQFIRRQIASAVALLTLSVIIKIGIVLQDYRLVLNQHYIAIWLSVAFLVAPDRRRTIPLLIVSIYFWAGVLKLSPDSNWLSGAALMGQHPLGLPTELLPAACAYVVLLEVVIAWGVLFTPPWLFWCAFAQLILFHVSSFWVVGFFYPCEMFCILSILLAFRYGESPPHRRRVAWSTAVVGLAFSACQLVPRAISQTPALTGEGRVFALNMFDAAVACESTLTFESGPNSHQVLSFRPPGLNARIVCDPIVYWSAATDYCRRTRTYRPSGDVSVMLRSRLLPSRTSHVIVDIQSFCAQPPSYSWLRANSWIRDPRVDIH